ncbi:MAG: efflux RND transporter permease subunit [Hyphomicrobiales bacterium]|nr:efflux RND transporter permease subunit [Hyphomicrobiales bacterium]
MSITRSSIDKSLLTWILMLGLLFGGIWGFNSLGRLEDPAFTIKQAVIVTQYPGASSEQVAIEVSEPLESAIQKMGEVDKITSRNQPGVSTIDVEIKSIIGAQELPAIWEKLRNEVSDAARSLPDDVSSPFVNDGFGDVFGLFYAVTAEGFTDAERHEISNFIRRELLTVSGVADIEIAGLPEEAVFVEPSLPLTVTQNVAPTAIVNEIALANSVVDAGHIDRDQQRTIIQGPEGSDTVEAISGLAIGVSGEILNVFDFADVYRGRIAHPDQIIRFNGKEAFTLGIAGLETENIVEVGKRVDARIAELNNQIPLGVELHPIYQQHIVVEQASNDFLVNLAMSVAIVVLVLAIFMGWRAAIVVGATLLLTVVGTLFFMAIFSIEMERISLGALIIAMGMLVDNAIVVAEGMQIQMRRGKASLDAAEEIGAKTQVPLLGATVIGIMAFAGIGLSPDSTGEFLFSLFAVIGISLILSWVLAVTVTPLLGHYLFKRGDQGAAGDDAYDGVIFKAYGIMLKGALKARWLVLIALVGITAACFAGFGLISQQFFPNSNTPLFFVHYKLQQGSDIHSTEADLAVIEKWLLERDDVTSVATFVGQGATRFMLTYSSEKPNTSYGHLIIGARTVDEIPALRRDLDAYAAQTLVAGEFRTERLVFGPGGGSPIEVRFAGSDPVVLRQLAQQAGKRMQEASDNLRHLRIDWRERELIVRPVYATERAQVAGIGRDDIANTLRFATEGIRAGTFREEDRLIPIIVRQSREDPTGLMSQVVYSSSGNEFVPIAQLVDGFEQIPQETLLMRRNRVYTITVQAGIPAELTAATVHAQIRDTIESMPLPVGYTMEWGGEFENSTEAQASLAGQLPVSFIIMILISILLFVGLRQPLIIWLLVPMSVNGVVLGLLGTGLPFTFTALLGLLSLSGMLIKNGIVLVEEIDLTRKEGLPLREAIVAASVSRLRPVLLAAATTILGMAPLLSDRFFESMAVTIMGGLAFASILTLIAAPVLYDMFFARDEARNQTAPQRGDAPAAA